MSDDFNPTRDAWLAERSAELARTIARDYPQPPPASPEQIAELTAREAARQVQAVREAGEPEAESAWGWAEYFAAHPRPKRTGDFSFIYHAIRKQNNG